MKLKNQIALLFTSLIALSASAQDKKEPASKTTEPAKEVMSEEIEVVRPYKPVLANAVKIRRNPDLNEAPKFKPVLSYNLLDKKLELNTDIRQLQYQQLAAAKPEVLFNNYAKIGLGNLKTGFGEVYLNNGRDEVLQTGFYAKHLNQQGELNKQQLSSQEFAIFGKSIGNKFTLSGDIGYKHLGTYFYGHDPVPYNNTAPPDKQQLNQIKLSGELANRYSNQTGDWAYALKADASFFKNNFNGRENTVVFSGLANKQLENFQFGLNSSLDLTSVKMTAGSISNNILSANPFVKFQGKGFHLNVGINLVQELGEADRLSTLPAISAEAIIDPNYATFFAGMNGDVNKTSLQALSFELPYLDQNISIKNAREKSTLYAGIKGNLGTGFGFKTKLFFKQIENLPLFVNKTGNLSHFEVVYDQGETKITGFEAEVTVKASNVFDFNGKLQLANYKTATEAKAWFKPGLRLETEARAQLNPKLALTASFVFNGDTYGKLNGQAVKVKSFMDFNAGANYQLNKKWGIYLQANNLLGKAYQQYLYYPKLGLNLIGGISYSF